MTNFDKNGIYFQYPESWRLTEEQWDDGISALTFEDEDGIYMVDIYHAGVGPELKDYANRHFKSFTNELPFLSKIIDGPNFINISEFGTPGLALEFEVKSYFLLKTRYINPVFKVVDTKSISFISGQYPKENSAVSGAGLNQVLRSYRAN